MITYVAMWDMHFREMNAQLQEDREQQMFIWYALRLACSRISQSRQNTVITKSIRALRGFVLYLG